MRGAIVAANSAVCRVAGVCRDDRVDVVGEAHVEHLVGFVEHEHLEGVEVERLAAQVIERAARRARRRRRRRGAARGSAGPSARRRRRGTTVRCEPLAYL